ncbi:hypothetical protein DFP74_4180 [Nocardiopsis sp. Huas11]|uniref:hypothetical protein n=1 Tax=Nocardiopsis sp. Huas11 TaxID=2183912 RepID=UPI000EADF102|nr:hypothetical protein [Nocardiopsis sp. Huas11]RKS08478.1 hypothetical protein DFP74_4180 [Nocardiopsis sp. Huas11]
METPVPAGRKLADAVLGAAPAATGAYIHRKQATASSAESYDTDRERALWNRLEQVQRTTA